MVLPGFLSRTRTGLYISYNQKLGCWVCFPFGIGGLGLPIFFVLGLLVNSGWANFLDFVCDYYITLGFAVVPRLTYGQAEKLSRSSL